MKSKYSVTVDHGHFPGDISKYTLIEEGDKQTLKTKKGDLSLPTPFRGVVEATLEDTGNNIIFSANDMVHVFDYVEWEHLCIFASRYLCKENIQIAEKSKQ